MAGATPLLQQHLTNLPSDVRALLLSKAKTEDKNFKKYFRHTLDSFSSEWGAVRESERAWGLDVPARRKLFLNCVGIGIEDMPGKKILDAGCGHGEVELALVKTGAEVFATDLSFSVDGVRDHLGKSEPAYASLVHIIQSNIHRLPFRQEVFDIVYSAGVLHHTPDTFRGFEILSLCLKDGGIGYVEVYTTERKNPIAHVISNALRTVTTRLPHPILHLFCFTGAPILWLYTHSYNALTGKKLYTERTIHEMELSLFDNFSPRYQHHHTTEQVMNWFNCLGYSNISKTFETKNVVGVVGTKQSGSKGRRLQDSQ
jgi:ubiquinone/menaquinone biosynthesis C-methylase UbiE